MIMASKKEIFEFLSDWAPTETALDFDNVGLLVDNETDEVNKVAVCLDITPETILTAKKMGAELIVSHHPVIFSPLKKLANNNPAVMLIKSGIAAICMHTNLDAADGGVNDALAEKIGLSDIIAVDSGDGTAPMMRMGEIAEMTADDFAAYLKEKLGCVMVKYVAPNRNIKKVAVCGGAGEEFLFLAAKNGCDALVTGETKHHINLAAKEMSVGIYCCGHFATEAVVKSAIVKRLSMRFSDLEIVELNEIDPTKYI